MGSAYTELLLRSKSHQELDLLALCHDLTKPADKLSTGGHRPMWLNSVSAGPLTLCGSGTKQFAKYCLLCMSMEFRLLNIKNHLMIACLHATVRSYIAGCSHVTAQLKTCDSLGLLPRLSLCQMIFAGVDYSLTIVSH